ncbi:MAG: thioredoxin-disulfide reductase [Bacilli bacterium]|nr:thioredoxin-disulfide reductase [Bacilli bacterium]
MYDIIIIGAGPAGMTAAIYARRALKKVLVLEATAYGGQIINTPEIDNYPVAPHISGFDFSTKLYNQAVELEAEFVFEKVIKINDKKSLKEVITSENKYEAKSVIIATGSDNRKLGIKNEVELVGKGVSYCATCDGNFYRGMDVAVVGGGNTAVEDALYLSNIANKVYLIRRKDKLRADSIEVDKLQKKKNIEFIYNASISNLIGKEKLEKIEVKTNEDTILLEISAIFIAIGRVPATENIKDLIETDEYGYIESNENCHTNIPGVFAAGDIRKKDLRQLVTATSDGAIAATEAIKYLNTNCK